MNTKTLSALAVAAVVAVGAATWINSANAPVSDETTKDKPLFAGLRDDLNKVDAFTLAGAGGNAGVALKRTGDGWEVAQRAGYPADVGKLREYLYKLADAKVLDTKTSNPKLYAELGVENPGDKDAKSVLVTLGGLKDPAKLIVGLFDGKGGGGTFVRRDGEAQSLLASGNLLAEKNPAAWIRKDLLDIDSARIKQVELTGIDGKTLRAYKEQSGDNNLRVADVPKGRELSSDFVANSLGAGLSNLRADDVAAAPAEKCGPGSPLLDSHDPGGAQMCNAPTIDKPNKARYLGFNGLVVEVKAWEFDGKPYAQFAASIDETQRDADIVAAQAKDKATYDTAVAAAKLKVVEAKGDDAAMAKAEAGVPKPASLADPAKDRADRIAALSKAVEDLNKNLQGWTFTLPLYEFTNFHKNMDELLKPLPTKQAAGAKGGKPAPPLIPPAKRP
jgi:hypothetical protein